MFATADRRAIWMTQFNIADYDYRVVLRGQRLPVLIIKGEHDAKINACLDSTLRALRPNPDFRLVEIAGAGHFSNMEKPERFNRELYDFLTEVAGVRGSLRKFAAMSY